MASRDELLVNVQVLRTTVTDLIQTVADMNSRLTTDVSGLMASGDGGVYGEDYAADRGPAVWARFFEESNDYNVRRMAVFTDQVTQLEATLAEMA